MKLFRFAPTQCPDCISASACTSYTGRNGQYVSDNIDHYGNEHNVIARTVVIAIVVLLSACSVTPSQRPDGARNENQPLTSNQPSRLDQARDANASDSRLNQGPDANASDDELSDKSEPDRMSSGKDTVKETDVDANKAHTEPDLKQNLYTTLDIRRAGRTGNLANGQLNEISGLTASMRNPGLLYAINDSGAQPRLFAIDQTGRLIGQWDIKANNRDWEDMTRLTVAGEPYLVIGDTGDNLRTRKSVELLFIREPELSFGSGSGSESGSGSGSGSGSKSLDPAYSIRFHYEDGPRDVEAFTVIGDTLYLLSKEPISAAGRSPSGIYALALPDSFNQDANQTTVLSANRIGTMPLRKAGLELALAATFAGVDLSHPTAMEFDAGTNSLYILTYREVLRVQRRDTESWASALSRKAELVLSHILPQAEALTTIPGQAVWFTSERTGAPLWAIPLDAPL